MLGAKEYLLKLKGLVDSISDHEEREIAYYLCQQYQKYKTGQRQNKYVTRKEIGKILYNVEGIETNQNGDRTSTKIRKMLRKLLQEGFPIVASNKISGYYIADTTQELAEAQKANHRRGLAILRVNKGYDRAMVFLGGQATMFDYNRDVEKEEYDEDEECSV